MAFFWVVVIRGGRKPRVVESTCNFADAFTLTALVAICKPPETSAKKSVDQNVTG